MFDVGRSRFYKKIKQLLKLSKTRVDTIINKRNAVHKFLKNDIAELLRNGLYVYAYGRAEGLLVELNMSSCYSFIEECVGCILAKLAAMDSQRECPNECREAVQSLLHATARIADMPELRELRTVFIERYGNSLEPFLNKDFAEKLRSGTPTKEKKLQLLQDIAEEYSIQFDPVSLERKIFKPAPPAQEKPNRRSLNDAEDDGYYRHKRKDDALPERVGHNRGTNISNSREHDVSKRNENDLRYRGKMGVPDDRYNIPCSSEEEVLANKRNNTSQDNQQTSSGSVGSFSKEKVDSRKPYYDGSIPTPYVMRNAVTESNGSFNAAQNDQSQPTSARKSTLKPPSGREAVSNESEENAMKGERERQQMQSIFNRYDEEIDEEEKKLDHLLMHDSNKKQPHESSKLKEGTSWATRHRHARASAYPSLGHGNDDTIGARRHRSARSELPHQPATARAPSIPSEPAAGHEGTRGHNQLKSMQLEMAGDPGHVHPKLPDYNDLAARLAALRGK